MISSAEPWSRRTAIRYALKPRTLGIVLLATALSIGTLTLLHAELRLPWIVGGAWIIVTPVFMRRNLMVNDDFEKREYLADRDEQDRALDRAWSTLGTLVGVGSIVGLYLALGLDTDPSVLLSEPRTVLDTGRLFDATIRSMTIMAFGGLGAHAAFFVRARRYYERGAVSLFRWSF